MYPQATVRYRKGYTTKTHPKVNLDKKPMNQTYRNLCDSPAPNKPKPIPQHSQPYYANVMVIQIRIQEDKLWLSDAHDNFYQKGLSTHRTPLKQ